MDSSKQFLVAGTIVVIVAATTGIVVTSQSTISATPPVQTTRVQSPSTEPPEPVVVIDERDKEANTGITKGRESTNVCVVSRLFLNPVRSLNPARDGRVFISPWKRRMSRRLSILACSLSEPKCSAASARLILVMFLKTDLNRRASAIASTRLRSTSSRRPLSRKTAVRSRPLRPRAMTWPLRRTCRKSPTLGRTSHYRPRRALFPGD
jgi:hypothetical protein